MRLRSALLTSLVVVSVLTASLVVAKEGVQATLHTPIPATAVAGSKLAVSWSLKVEESDEPFSACGVFIRLTGPTGESTEAFTECADRHDGHYTAIATIPSGGVSRVEIGVAGRMTNRQGQSQRSDWLMPLVTEASEKRPLQKRPAEN